MRIREAHHHPIPILWPEYCNKKRIKEGGRGGVPGHENGSQEGRGSGSQYHRCTTAESTTNCLVIEVLGAEAAWSGELAQLQLLHVCLFLLIVVFLLFLLLPGVAALLNIQP
jgi:hypothetical protein